MAAAAPVPTSVAEVLLGCGAFSGKETVAMVKDSLVQMAETKFAGAEYEGEGAGRHHVMRCC
jgi:hypothetical protein